MSKSPVSAAVRRVRVIVESLQEAHALGIPAGTATDMTTIEYQESVLSIYRLTLDARYLHAVADIYAGAAAEMERTSSIVPQSWSLVARFLDSVSRVFRSVELDDEPLCELPSQPSPIIRYAELARTVSPAAVARLHGAVEHVLEFTDSEALVTGSSMTINLNGFDGCLTTIGWLTSQPTAGTPRDPSIASSIRCGSCSALTTEPRASLQQPSEGCCSFKLSLGQLSPRLVASHSIHNDDS